VTFRFLTLIFRIRQVLLEDFGFRRIEAIKLERFARHGWKPILDRASLNHYQRPRQPQQLQQQLQQPLQQEQQTIQMLYLQPEPLYTDV